MNDSPFPCRGTGTPRKRGNIVRRKLIVSDLEKSSTSTSNSDKRSSPKRQMKVLAEDSELGDTSEGLIPPSQVKKSQYFITHLFEDILCHFCPSSYKEPHLSRLCSGTSGCFLMNLYHFFRFWWLGMECSIAIYTGCPLLLEFPGFPQISLNLKKFLEFPWFPQKFLETPWFWQILISTRKKSPRRNGRTRITFKKNFRASRKSFFSKYIILVNRYLGIHVKKIRIQNKNTVFVCA